MNTLPVLRRGSWSDAKHSYETAIDYTKKILASTEDELVFGKAFSQ